MASPPIGDREYAARIPLKFNDIHDQVFYTMESSKLKVQKSCRDGGGEGNIAGKIPRR